MELQIHINGGNRCDVRFEHHHKFKRVITLLRISEEDIGIVDQTGKNYNKEQLVKDCIKENNTGQINIVFQVNKPPGGSRVVNDSPHTQRVIGVIHSFFQYMERRKFKKLENYWDHNQGIFRQVARFSKTYERLYIMQLFWKNQIIQLKPEEERQLKQYQEKYKSEYDKISREKGQWLNAKMKADKGVIEFLQGEVDLWKTKAEENAKNNNKQIAELKKQCQRLKEQLKMKVEEKQEQISQLKNTYEISNRNLQFQLDKNIDKILQTQREKSQLNSKITQLEKTKEKMSYKVSTLENQLSKVMKDNDLFQSKLFDMQKQLQIVSNDKNKIQEDLNELQQRNELVNLGASISLEVKIKKKQSFIIPQRQESLLSKIINCNSQITDKMLKKMGKEGSRVQYEMIHQWPQGERLSVWNISKKVYSKTNENILLVCKTKEGKIVGGFSTLKAARDIDSGQSYPLAFLFSLQSLESKLNIFTLKKKKVPLTYDEGFLVFGDQDLSLDYQNCQLTCRLARNLCQSELSFEDVDSGQKDNMLRYKFLGQQYQDFAELEWYCLISCKFD